MSPRELIPQDWVLAAPGKSIVLKAGACAAMFNVAPSARLSANRLNIGFRLIYLSLHCRRRRVRGETLMAGGINPEAQRARPPPATAKGTERKTRPGRARFSRVPHKKGKRARPPPATAN